MRLSRHVWLVLSIALIVLAATAPAAFADTFTVNTTADSSDASGCTTATVCSLRDAVAAANGASGSTITLPSGDYVLNTGATPLGQLAVTAPTTIAGADTRTTIVDGNGQSRVFDFEPSAVSSLLTLSSLTVTGGSAQATATVTDPGDGGGIFSLGGLDLEHVAVTGNTAALGGGGVMDGTIHGGSQPGPAIFNGVTIADNTVTGGAPNGQGGGAVVATTLTMTNSTLAGNSVSNVGINEGGGLVSATNGSGLTATLINDTITNNSVSKPGGSPTGDMGAGVSGDSISGGGLPVGGLVNGGLVRDTAIGSGPFNSVLSATNTIVAGNQADGAEQDCALLSNTGASSSHSIQGDTSCGFSDANSQTTTAVGLGTLGNNGGPTDTALTAASSPAVDTGDGTACPASDERGVPRPQLSGCDIGATELAPPSAMTGAASALTPTTATLNATASDPSVSGGTATFEYGTTTAYGQSVSGGGVAGGVSGATLSAPATALSPATLYHYRVVVTTADGTARGADVTFTTAALTPPPTPGPVPPPAPTPIPAPVPTRTALVCSPAVATVGRAVKCTITVTNVKPGVTPSGAARITLPAHSGILSSPICGLLASGTKAHFAVTYLPTGTGARTVRAAYSGDARHLASRASAVVTVRGTLCNVATGSLTPSRLGPILLGTSRTQVRATLRRYLTRTRAEMDFLCLAHGSGIRVGYMGGRTALALTANPHYHAGSVHPGSTLGAALRTLPIWTHFVIGRNTWYLARAGATSYVLKVRNGMVQEIGAAMITPGSDPGRAQQFMSSFS
jgi:CSLREA domain-containing protein